MIDAYLYNKTINPSYGVKKINVDYGPHENYIRKIYPYKDIPVYENTETLDFFTKKPMQKASNIANKTPWKGANNNLEHKIFGSLILMNISRNEVHMIQTVKLYQD